MKRSRTASRWGLTWAGMILLCSGLVLMSPRDSLCQIRSDEQVILFPTTARQSDDGSRWHITVHGWIFEPEEDSILRAELARQLERFLAVDITAAQRTTFHARLRPFLVDNERGKTITMQVGSREVPVGPSAVDGHFEQTVQLSNSEAQQLMEDGKLTIRALTPPTYDRQFTSTAYFLAPQGISVISDIDDTIKVTEMHDKERVFRNTFLEPFVAVDGMAEVYRRWADEGAHMHYVSMSPWQLYSPLSAFVRDAGFPAGSFYLRRFRPKDSSLLTLLGDPLEAKQAVISGLMQQYPERRFVLVGDSGQRDPEVYGLIYRQFPESIQHIYIRNVSREAATAPRYEAAFRDLPRDKWTVFDRAAEIIAAAK